MSSSIPETIAFFRRNLPHWLVAERTYFVTLRVRGTVPRSVVESHRQEREELIASGSGAELLDSLHLEQFRQIEDLLDRPERGWLPLKDESVARMLHENHAWLRGQGWVVYAATLMGNHTHYLMRNDRGRTGELVNDLDAFKRFTGRQINKLLQRQGRFWATDNFDHWIRQPEQFEHFVRYIAYNPVNAGLVAHWRDWPWTEIDESVLYCLDE